MYYFILIVIWSTTNYNIGTPSISRKLSKPQNGSIEMKQQ
jgi:hypothetical protein